MITFIITIVIIEYNNLNAVVVVVVDPGTLAKCQCTPLPTRRYNHGEVASTIIELHCNSIAAPLRVRCGLQSYLNLDLQKRSSHPGSFTESLVVVGYLLTKRKQGNCVFICIHVG